MIDKNELLNTYNTSKNRQIEKMHQLRNNYIEPMIDEQLRHAAKRAKTHIEIDVISMFKAIVRNKSYMHINDKIILNEVKNLIEDYAKIITIENIEDLRYIYDEPNEYKNYIFVIDK